MSKARAAKMAGQMGASNLSTRQRRKTIMLAEMEMETTNEPMDKVFLDPEQKSPRAQDFEERE